jgi:hypothetical protein
MKDDDRRRDACPLWMPRTPSESACKKRVVRGSGFGLALAMEREERRGMVRMITS